jgi:hypothetical protein
MVNLEFLVADSVQNGHTYTIEFGDTSYFHNEGTPYYIIYDEIGDQKYTKTDTIWIDQVSQSPLIDGFVVTVQNDEADLDRDETGWLVGSTNYGWRVNFDPRFSHPDPKNILNLNINYPADYEITFSNQLVDTAKNQFLPPDLPTKFSVYNLTEGQDANFMFFDFVGDDNTLTPYKGGKEQIDGMVIWVPDDRPDNPLKLKTSWRLFFEYDSTLGGEIPPAPGDIFKIATKKPFRTGDKISFKVNGARYDEEKAKTDLEEIAVVPNPYVVTAGWEEKSPFRFGRGERKIHFIHLPRECIIRIYTLRGHLVDIIEHKSTFDDGQEAWNMLNKDGQDISFGLYIFHVDAPSIGQKIGKFAVIK